MARILVVDDEAVVRTLIEEILADAGHDVVGVGSGAECLDRLDDDSLEIVVSDILMPDLSGLELLDEVRERRPSLPVVLVTGGGTQAIFTQALSGGANGLVMKPFSHAELQDVVATALERADRAERELRMRLLTPTLAGALANAIEARDPTMQGHCERMSALAMRLGVEFGLDDAELEVVRLGAILHDVGKIGIPARVLLSDDALTDEELALMRTHPLIGDRLLEPLDLLESVRPVVRHHHERWDGAGYPDGLAGEAIPRPARIVALADAVEAMSGDRSWRAPLTKEEVVQELDEGSGSQWDPSLAEIARRLILSGELAFEPRGLSLSNPPPPVDRRKDVTHEPLLR